MFTAFFPSDQLYLVIASLWTCLRLDLIGHPVDTQVPCSRWFSAKFVVVPQQTHQQLCQWTESAVSRCAGSPDCPFLWWLCVDDTCLDSCPPRHPCDAKRIESSSDTGKKLASVSFSSNNCGLPRPLRSLSSSASSGVEIIVSDFGFLVGESQFCCRHLQRLTLCSPLLVFDVFGYPCLCQYFCWRNCHTLLDRDSSVIEIAIPLSPHLKIVTRRSSAHQKHHAQRQCPSLPTAGWLTPRGHTPGFRRHQLINVFQHRIAGFARSSSLLWARTVLHLQNLCVSWWWLLTLAWFSFPRSGLKQRTQLGGHSWHAAHTSIRMYTFSFVDQHLQVPIVSVTR